MSEIPVHLVRGDWSDWINPTEAKKVHSLVDKVYSGRTWRWPGRTVKANRGSGGVDGQSLEEFAAKVDQQLDRLHRELKGDVYRPQPVRRVMIPKPGGGETPLGIPTVIS